MTLRAQINISKLNEERILVTGGSGLIGSALRECVLSLNGNILHGCDNQCTEEKGWIFLNSKQTDLKNRELTFQLFEKLRPTIVIHLAAEVGGVFWNMQRKLEMFQNNIDINTNVIRASQKFRVHSFISCLSTCIFPDGIELPIRETDIHKGEPHSSNSGYAFAKRMLDVETKLWKEKEGNDLRIINLIPTNIFGSNDNYNITVGHVVPSLIQKAYHAARDNSNYEIYGTGKPLRQFIYARDLADIILWLMLNYDEENKEDNPNIIIADPSEYSIKEIALFIANYFAIPSDNIIFDSTKTDGQFRKTADVSKLKRLLPDNFEFTPFFEALGSSCQWFAENYDIARK